MDLAQAAPDGLEFRILGPVEVASNGERLGLGGEKQRALLALLLLHGNEVVSRDRIIDALWGERPPATVAAALNVYVSKLRKILGDAGAREILVTQEPGYVLRVETGQLDSDRFTQLSAEGKRALESGEHDVAAAKLSEALSLFRGRALDDLHDEDFARVAGARLEDARFETLINRIQAELGRGEASELVAELESLVQENPLQERLWGELMLALYRSGRQADALAAYQRAREQLDELGIDPGPELKRLQSQILRHDPALRLAPAPPRTEPRAEPKRGRHRWWRRRRSLAVAGAALLATAVGVGVAVTNNGEGTSVAPAPNSIRVFDLKTNRALATVPLGGSPGGLAFGEGAIWAANEDDSTVLRIDPTSMKVTQTIGVPDVTDVAAGAGALWAVARDGTEILRIPVDAPDLSTATPISRLAALADPAEVPHLLAIGGGSIWTLDGPDGIARLAPTGRMTMRVALPGSAPDEIAFGAGFLWIVDSTNRRLLRVDARTSKVLQTPAFGRAPISGAVGFDAVWDVDYYRDLVWRINPILGEVERSIPVGHRPISVAVGAGAVWVAGSYDSTITKIDPATNQVLGTIHVGYLPTRIVVSRDKLWVMTR